MQILTEAEQYHIFVVQVRDVFEPREAVSLDCLYQRN